MPLFTSEMKDLNSAVAFLGKNKRKLTVGTTGAATLTADQLIDGIYSQADGGSAANITTPTGAQIVAAIPHVEVGMSFDFVLLNNDAGDAMTLTAGASGVTVSGGGAVAATKAGRFLGVVTAVDTPTVVLYRTA